MQYRYNITTAAIKKETLTCSR